MKSRAEFLISAIVVAAIASVCCSIGRTTSRATTDRATGDPHVVGAAELRSNSDEARLQRGRQHVRDLDFDKAIEELSAVAEASAAKPELRAAALLELGGVYSSPFNSKVDKAKAIRYYRRLVAEYPESELRKEAESRAKAIEKQLGNKSQ